MRLVGQVMLGLCFAFVLAGGWTYHRARAQVGETLLDLGANMMRYAEARNQDAPRDLMLNGERIRFSSGTAARTTADVLDFFETRCEQADGGLSEQLEALRASGALQSSSLGSSGNRTLALREDNGQRGYVACIDFKSSVGPSELVQRIQRFGETGDVSEIGEMRYVFAQQYEHEGELRAHFVALWTTDSFNVARMFPEDGDAPGHDIEGVSRPATARRVLTGFERGQSYVLNVYQTREDEGALDRFYRDALTNEGFAVVEAVSPTSADAPRTLIAERGERMVTIVFSTDLSTGWANAAIIDAR